MTADAPASPSLDLRDVEAFLRVPRVSAIAAGPGGRAAAVVQEADEHLSRLVPALWELTAEGPARRLTVSEKGESSPCFAPDGSLLFTSSRPDPTGEAPEGTTAIWRLPLAGEAQVLAHAPGGLELLDVAGDGTILAATSVLPGVSLEEDAEARAARKDAKRTTIWHTGMPIRQWDHERGDSSRHLLIVTAQGELRDLTPDAGTLPLHTASAVLARDGRTVVTEWTERIARGETRTSLVRIDGATRERTPLLEATDEHGYDSPVLSPDGRLLAVTRSTVSTPTDTSYGRLEIHDLEGGGVVAVDLGDLTAGQVVWQADGGTLLVSGDLHSSGAVLAVDPSTGAVSTLADGGVFSSLSPAEDGSVLALRSDVATPARPVRITAEGVVELPAPGAVGPLPDTLEKVTTTVGGVEVPGWLCTPVGASAEDPAPTLLWVHGGPHSSYNAWSWRWCPWLFTARGYAVLMPDPAMSTGYGDAGLNRGWPRRPDVVLAECEALLDLVLERPELDGTRTAMLGASFGGFMANWIAGHTDRFDAIVSHAGLWALPQQHRTTDAAASKMRVHGHEDADPEWYRACSPHAAAAAITTPMLVTHGSRDFRVPISEALRLWWDLVSHWDGAPEDMPHRFLQLTSENHWVLTPSNALTWNETVLAFLDQHVRGGEPIPEALPW